MHIKLYVVSGLNPSWKPSTIHSLPPGLSGMGRRSRKIKVIEIVGLEQLKNCSKVEQNKSINANTNCNKRNRGET